MRDVLITTFIFVLLFIVLTTEMTTPMAGMSVETLTGMHRLFSELIFWAGTLYLCATGTFGALMRQDRFALSQKHPFLNRILGWVLLASPFLAVFVNVRFVFVMLGLLLFSHMRSKTEEERNIELSQSRALSNMLLIPIFTLALMLMSMNGYQVVSLFDIGTFKSSSDELVMNSDEIEVMEDAAYAR